jgi:hypothetical protein
VGAQFPDTVDNWREMVMKMVIAMFK